MVMIIVPTGLLMRECLEDETWDKYGGSWGGILQQVAHSALKCLVHGSVGGCFFVFVFFLN